MSRRREPTPADDGAFLEAALAVLALRLKHEVALTRAFAAPTAKRGSLASS